MSFQKLILCGELTTEPELRYNQSGLPCCAFRLKTVESWTAPDGQVREFAEIHKILVWGKDAERVAKEFKKGHTAIIEGRNQTRPWKAENGLDVEITEVVPVPNGIRFPGHSRPAEPAARERPKTPAPLPQDPPAEGPKRAPDAQGPVKPAAAEEKPKRASPVKPAPPKPDKVSVDLAKAAETEDLPF